MPTLEEMYAETKTGGTLADMYGVKKKPAPKTRGITLSQRQQLAAAIPSRMNIPRPTPQAATQPDYGFGSRWDEKTKGYTGSPKGLGYFGMIQRLDNPRDRSSELSIGVNIGGKEMEIPSMVPGLTTGEMRQLLSSEKMPQSVIEKATTHAKQRLAAGKSVWAQPGEQQQFPGFYSKDGGRGPLAPPTRATPVLAPFLPRPTTYDPRYNPPPQPTLGRLGAPPVGETGPGIAVPYPQLAAQPKPSVPLSERVMNLLVPGAPKIRAELAASGATPLQAAKRAGLGALQHFVDLYQTALSMTLLNPTYLSMKQAMPKKIREQHEKQAQRALTYRLPESGSP